MHRDWDFWCGCFYGFCTLVFSEALCRGWVWPPWWLRAACSLTPAAHLIISSGLNTPVCSLLAARLFSCYKHRVILTKWMKCEIRGGRPPDPCTGFKILPVYEVLRFVKWDCSVNCSSTHSQDLATRGHLCPTPCLEIQVTFALHEK